MTKKRYYGDQSPESFYAGGLYERKLQRRENARRLAGNDRKKCLSLPAKMKSSQSSKAVLKTVSGNLERSVGTKKSAGKGSKKAFGQKHKKPMDESLLENSRRSFKKPKTIPQPTVYIDPQEDMHLLLVEGSFPHGVDRLNYLSNVYYHADSSLLPNKGRCLDVLPPTKMASGPWILVAPSGDPCTLGDQRDWAGHRIRWASPKAASVKSLQHVRVSPTVDLLGSMTVAAFTGFCTHDEFHDHEEALARKVLERSKSADWSTTVTNLPSFKIDSKLKCAGGFSIAVNFDPSLHSYYLKIGICETLKEILCVELVFPLRYKQIPTSASTIGPPLTRQNLNRLESFATSEGEDVNEEKKSSKSEQRNLKATTSWKFDVETFSVPSYSDRIFSPCQHFPTNKVTVESSLSQEPHDADSENMVDVVRVKGEQEASEKASAFQPSPSSEKSVSKQHTSISKICQIPAAQFPEFHIEEHPKGATIAKSPVFADAREEVIDREFFDASSEPQLEDDIVVNPATKSEKGTNLTAKMVLLVTALCFLIVNAVFQGSTMSFGYMLSTTSTKPHLHSMMKAMTSGYVEEWTTRLSWYEKKSISGTPKAFPPSFYDGVGHCAKDMEMAYAEACPLDDPAESTKTLQPSKFNKKVTSMRWRPSFVTLSFGLAPALVFALNQPAATELIARLALLPA